MVVNLTVDIFCIEFYPRQGHLHHLLLFTEHGLRDHKAEAEKGGTSPESAAGIASIKHNRKVTKVVAENVNREEGERTGERPYPIYTTKEYGFNEANRLREEQKLKDMFSGFNRVAK